jgi:hypothetical protein
MRRKNASLVRLASPPSRGRPRRNPRRRLPPALPLSSPLPLSASAAGQSPCGASGIFLTQRWSLSRGMLLVAVRPGARTSSTGGDAAAADDASCPRAVRRCCVWWCVVDVGADCPCAWWITSPLETPRGRYDECSSKFSLSLRNQGYRTGEERQ